MLIAKLTPFFNVSVVNYILFISLSNNNLRYSIVVYVILIV